MQSVQMASRTDVYYHAAKMSPYIIVSEGANTVSGSGASLVRTSQLLGCWSLHLFLVSYKKEWMQSLVPNYLLQERLVYSSQCPYILCLSEIQGVWKGCTGRGDGRAAVGEEACEGHGGDVSQESSSNEGRMWVLAAMPTWLTQQPRPPVWFWVWDFLFIWNLNQNLTTCGAAAESVPEDKTQLWFSVTFWGWG